MQDGTYPKRVGNSMVWACCESSIGQPCAHKRGADGLRLALSEWRVARGELDAVGALEGDYGYQAADALADAVKRLALGGDTPDRAMPLLVSGERVCAAMPCQDREGAPFRGWLVLLAQADGDRFAVRYARWAPIDDEWRGDDSKPVQEGLSWGQALTWFAVWAANEVPDS